jgi:Ca2+-binding EF-hand superfamily protein
VQWPKLSKAQEKEIEDWVVEELTTGEKTITKQEAHDAIVAFADKHGFPQPTAEQWEQLEEMFDYVDKNGDGAIDLEELKAAMKKHGPGKKGDLQMRMGARQFIQAQVQWPKLSKAQEKEIEDWVVEELTTGEKTITKQEAHDAIVAFADKHGFPQPTAEQWEQLEEMFDYVDANGDGAIDLEELKAAMKKHCPKHAKLQIR